MTHFFFMAIYLAFSMVGLFVYAAIEEYFPEKHRWWFALFVPFSILGLIVLAVIWFQNKRAK